MLWINLTGCVKRTNISQHYPLRDNGTVFDPAHVERTSQAGKIFEGMHFEWNHGMLSGITEPHCEDMESKR